MPAKTIDILDDGTLDLPDATLAGLDEVTAAVDRRFDLARERQAERILRALDPASVSLLARTTTGD